MADRKEFLQSKLETKENIYTGTAPIKPNHIWIFKNISDMFQPSASGISDILKFTSDKDLNVCRDKTLVIFFKQTSADIVNSLKFHLLMNFIVNWREYNDYIYKITKDEYGQNLTVGSTSIDNLIDESFDNENTSNTKSLDILFIYATKPIQRGELYLETLKNLIESRSIKGLITIVLYLGSEGDFKKTGIESRLFGVYYKKLNFNTSSVSSNTSTKKTSHTIKSKENDMNICEEEIF